MRRMGCAYPPRRSRCRPRRSIRERRVRGVRARARLGYDGVELMVFTDPVSQDIDAVRTALRRPRRARPRGPRAVPARDPTGLGQRPVGQARAGPRRRPSCSAPRRSWSTRRSVGSGSTSAAFVEGIASDGARRPDVKFAVENMYPWRARAAARSRRTPPPGTPPSIGLREHHAGPVPHARSPGRTRGDGAASSATGCATCTWPTAPARRKDEHLVPGRGAQPCAEVLGTLAEAGLRRQRSSLEMSTRRTLTDGPSARPTSPRRWPSPGSTCASVA